MSLSDRILKIAKSHNKSASVLEKSTILNTPYLAKLDVPMLNVALSGELDSGFYSGCMQVVGDSRTFKTCFGLIMLAAYLKEHPDAIGIFFDSERGASFAYFDTFGIDKSRVVHCPIRDVEDLKIQCAQYLDEIENGEKVFFFIDSVGLLPSRKEAEDASEGKTVADMTRARALNSFWRVVTNPVGMKNLFLVAINHYYETIGGMYPDKVIKGGKGGFLAANDIWIISRSKIKEGTDLAGWSFNINTLKSRKVKENARIPIEVMYDGGINKHSGLLEVARVTGHIESPKKGWYTRTVVEGDKNWRKGEMDGEFWAPLLRDQSFKEAVKKMYSLSSGEMFSSNIDQIIEEELEIDLETGEILNYE